jgi:hypothetical protein
VIEDIHFLFFVKCLLTKVPNVLGSVKCLLVGFQGVLTSVTALLLTLGNCHIGWLSTGHISATSDLHLVFIKRRLLAIIDCLIPVSNCLFEIDYLLLSIGFMLHSGFNVR